MSYLNVKRICRLCCKKNSRMRSLFEHQQEYPLPLQQMIYAISQLELDPNDGMPQKVCATCIKTLIRMYETVEVFRANDMKLREQLTRTMHVEIMDIMEVDNACVKQEVLDEEYHEWEQQKLNDESAAEPMNEVAITKQGFADEETEANKDDYAWKPTELNTDIKKPPMEEHNNGSAIADPMVNIAITKHDFADNENEAIKDSDEWKPTELNADINMLPLEEHNNGSEVANPLDEVTVAKHEETDEHGDEDEWTSEAQDSTGEKKQPPRKKKTKRPHYSTKFENSYLPHLHDFKCYICKSESHGSTEALMEHMNSSHTDQLPFTCTDCVMEQINFKSVLTLNAHLREHLKPEKCPNCDRRFASKYKVALHVQRQHAPLGDYVQRPSKCKYCDEEYPSMASLMQHMKQVHSAEAASCAFCGEVFKERYLLRLHIQKRHEPDKIFECDVCKRVFASRNNLQNHTKTFHSNEEFKCSYCSKKFRMKFRLEAHEKRHAENPNYVPVMDWSEYYTVLEGEEKKPGDKRMKKCNICGVVAAKSMTDHLRNVHFPLKYDCDVCGWTTKNRENYKCHMVVHKEGKNQQCPICERKFFDKRQLVTHLRAKMHRNHPLAKSLDWLRDRSQKQPSGESSNAQGET